MNEEYVVLMKNKSWKLVPLKHGTNVFDYRWIYKIKPRFIRSTGRLMGPLKDTRLD
jgi:hypothetical protein